MPPRLPPLSPANAQLVSELLAELLEELDDDRELLRLSPLRLPLLLLADELELDELSDELDRDRPPR